MTQALADALNAPSPSARLQAALTAGTRPDPSFIETLIARCAVEPDFYVRDMLTWALLRNDSARVVARLLPELSSEIPQARSQALHSLTKIGDRSVWPSITDGLLHDADDEVARTAWRAAAALVPEDRAADLADALTAQFGRGDRDVQLSLSRAFAAIGDAAQSAVERAQSHSDPEVQAHAGATARIMEDPDEGFDAAMHEARKTVALRDAPELER